MRTVQDIDASLRRCLAHRRAGRITHRDFERVSNTLLEARHYLTTQPDTGDTVPTREALDGSTRTST